MSEFLQVVGIIALYALAGYVCRPWPEAESLARTSSLGKEEESSLEEEAKRAARAEL